ncbi:MAG: response regulator transcription factor [Campylobacterota bacterium]
MKILLLEDEVLLNDSITQYLQNCGYVVESYREGQSALEAACESDDFDLLILDINVPKTNGFEMLQQLNERKESVHVIFISALVDVEDILKGYELGCSEYIKKPFHLEELGIKINQIVKKEQNFANRMLFSKNYSYCKDNQTLYYKNEPCELTKKQVDIIHTMALNINMVVDFERFRLDVWEGSNIDNPTIRAEISRLKKTLKEDFIKNIRGLGYKIERYYPR